MFYDKFIALCRDRGIKPSAAAREIGLNKSTVSLWKRDGLMPRMSNLTKIAAYFGVPVNHFTDDEPRDIEIRVSHSLIGDKKIKPPETDGKEDYSFLDDLTPEEAKSVKAFVELLRSLRNQ